jgi:glycosyltransferase involved in cell wall biosynthesis
MRILFDARVLTHSTFTGIENYTKYILEKISDKLDIAIAKPTNKNKYLAHLWTHFILPFKSGDILFCPANTAPIFVPKSKNLVMTVHDLSFLTYSKYFSKIFQIYYSFLIPFNIKRADSIITISEASKKEILRLFPNAEHKINIIPHGIDNKYRVLDNLQKKKQILYAGSINERKNLIGLIEAFEKLPKDLGYNLIIVANFFNLFFLSDKMKEVLKRAKNNKKIIFKEGLDDEALVSEYNVSTIFIFPSFYEGFGLPPLEAMACGTPVITSNISSMPEVCGDAALYANPYDVDDISKKIEFLINNQEERERLIEKGLDRVSHFTWERSANKHLDVMKGLVE